MTTNYDFQDTERADCIEFFIKAFAEPNGATYTRTDNLIDVTWPAGHLEREFSRLIYKTNDLIMHDYKV